MGKGICKIDECFTTVYAKALCPFHYERNRKYGDPLGGSPRRQSKLYKRFCGLPGCDQPYDSDGLCYMHYHRRLYSGFTETWEQRFHRETAEAAYEFQVDRSAGPDECHPWTGRVNEHGYGVFFYRGDKQYAQRWGYRRHVGALMSGELVRHICHNPPCQNPAHWLKGSHADNAQDMIQAGRSLRGSKQPNAKVTAHQVLEMRRAYAAGGVTYRELGERYGLHPGTVGGIINRSGWAWLTEAAQADYELGG